MRNAGRIWKVLAICVLMVFMLGCSVVTSLIGPTATPTPIPPTATPTPIPVYMLKGRLLYKDGNAAVANTTLMISNEKGSISIGSGGRLENPQGKTDSDGKFEIVLNEDYLKKNDYTLTLLVSLYNPSTFTNNLVPMRDDNGILIVIQLPTNPVTVDIGDVYVR